MIAHGIEVTLSVTCVQQAMGGGEAAGATAADAPSAMRVDDDGVRAGDLLDDFLAEHERDANNTQWLVESATVTPHESFEEVGAL